MRRAWLPISASEHKPSDGDVELHQRVKAAHAEAVPLRAAPTADRSWPDPCESVPTKHQPVKLLELRDKPPGYTSSEVIFALPLPPERLASSARPLLINSTGSDSGEGAAPSPAFTMVSAYALWSATPRLTKAATRETASRIA